MKYIKNYNFLSFFLLILTGIFVIFVQLPNSFELHVKNISIFINLIALFMSLYFGKSKIFFLLLLPLFFVHYMYHPTLLGLDGGKYSFWYMYPLVLATGYLIISLLQERAIMSIYGFFKFFIIFSLLLLSYFFIKNFSLDLRLALEMNLVGLNSLSFIKIQDFALILSLISLVFTAIFSFIFYGKSQSDKSLFWTLLALLIPSYFFEENFHFLLFYSLSAILAIIAILEDAYTMAYIDTLTKIPGRRALEDEFLKLGSTYTIAMVDIDFFKKFNDTYGHDIGDEVLKLIALQLSQVKGGGKAYRYGGEEFTILFKSKTAEQAFVYLEDIRESIAKRGFIIRDKNRPKKPPKQKVQPQNQKTVSLSVSIGVATSSKESKIPSNVMKLADEALYKAKEAGRNCVMKAA